MSLHYEYGEGQHGDIVRLTILEDRGWRLEADVSSGHWRVVPAVELTDAQLASATREIERLHAGPYKVPANEQSMRDVLRVVRWAVKYDTTDPAPGPRGGG